jgi:basic membrane protein A
VSQPTRIKVGLVLGTEGAEHDYNRGAYLGIERAVEELGVRGRVLTPAPREGFVPSLSLLVRERYDLVIAQVFAAAAVDAVAVRFPGTQFAILDVSHEALEHRPPNVQGLRFREEEVSYLAGYLAARMASTEDGGGVISAVGGEPVPAVERLIAGYRAGAQKASPGVTVLVGYTRDFLDLAKGRAVALGQIAAGSRVVFQVAGACGLGAIEAARERGVWAIGVDVDQSALGDHVLTSAVKRLDLAVFRMIEQCVNGEAPTGGTSILSLADGGLELGSFSPVVPRSLIDELERLTAQVAADGVELAERVS